MSKENLPQGPSVRLIIDSGLVITAFSVCIWIGGIVNTIAAQAHDISSLREDNKVLSKDLVETQKDIIKRLTRIETKMDIP